MSLFDNPDVEIRSMTKAGVVFLVALFIVVVIYFLIGGVVDALFDAFLSGDWANAETQKNTYVPSIRIAFRIFLAILVSIPVVWFFFWVFHREPAYIEVNDQQWR